MPGELKQLLSKEVRSSGKSLNDVAVGILASRFAVPFEPSGRPGKAPGRSGTVLLRMPAELKETLAARAAQRKRKLNDLIVETLSERLGGKDTMASTNGSNGKARRSNGKVRVAIVGVGNCASSLVQGVEFYKDAEPGTFVPGLMHVDLGGYHVATSSSRRRSTSPPTRSARISPTRSGRTRTTRSSSRTSRRPASPSTAG